MSRFARTEELLRSSTMMARSVFLLSLLAASICFSADSPTTQPRAARSVHLSYVAPPATAFYAEVTVEKSVPGSYFEVCGFNGGYFGIQELSDGKKVGIFSVWDTARGDDPKAVDAKDRVETLYTGEGVRVKRFGGEGTGGHSDFDFDWKVNSIYRFYIAARVDGKKTAYSAYIFQPDPKLWKKIATFQAPDGGKKLTGLYSFIEDFRRDTKSAGEIHRARFSNQWIKTEIGEWMPVTKAKFTASGASWEARTSINAGVDGAEFFLETGGDTRQALKLNDTIERKNDVIVPADLPDDGK